MGEWKRCKLGDVIELKRGYDLPQKERQPGGVPVVSSSGISDKHAVAKVKGPGVVTGRYGTIGTVYYIVDDFWPLNTTLYVRDFKGNDPRFVSYFLRGIDFHAYSDKAAVPGLNRNHLHEASVLIPTLPEQRAIAATLGALDDKIELNRKMNATLEAMARALFRDWFVDFGPTRAKMAGRPPYLSPDLWPLFPARLDADGKPEGWEVRPLVDCFDLLMGQSPPGDTYNDNGEGLPFFQGRTDFGFRYPENRKYCSAPTRVAEKGDTLVSVRAPVGDINLAAERCCIGRGVAAIRHKAGKKSFTYYAAWSLQEELRQYESTGTVFGAINKKQFEKLPTIDPGPKVIEAFEEIASALDSRIENNERESRTLGQTRDLLLPRLMSGEVRVAGAERVVEEVL
jgi:type I restriction enzyme S subunit